MSQQQGTEEDAPLLVWGTYDDAKPRIRILIAGLRRNGVPVLAVPVDVWSGVRDRGTLTARERRRVVWRYLASLPRLVSSLLRAPRHRAILVPYPGLFDVCVAVPIARLRGTPIVWDIFISAYDTVVNDRRMYPRWHPLALILYAVEWCACRMVDAQFLDTVAHARRFEALMGLRAGRVGAVPLGTDPARFPPRGVAPAATPFTVLFYGQYIPLHGLDTIVRAAAIVEGRGAPVRWILVGAGQEQARVTALIAELSLRSVEQRGWVASERLPAVIHASHVGLGIFGTSGKALTVVPNKVYELAATNTTIVSGDTPAMTEFAPGHPRVLRVTPGDPAALADAILALAARGVETEPALPVVGPMEVGAACLRAAPMLR